MQSFEYNRFMNPQANTFPQQVGSVIISMDKALPQTQDYNLFSSGYNGVNTDHLYKIDPLEDKYIILKEVCVLPIPASFEQFFLDKYCLCDSQEAKTEVSPICEEADIPELSNPKTYKTSKKNLLSRYDFPAKADALLNMLSGIDIPEGQPLISAGKKAEPKRGPVCSTRSGFIGVTRNGPQWQSLISVGKRKTYIGSYRTERECAMAFDFHSLLLHGLTAKTNFGYTKEDIVEMIWQYRQRGDKLSPSTLSFY